MENHCGIGKMVHIYFESLGCTRKKTFSNKDLTNKVLRYLSRKWQPKVITIVESRNLEIMTLATLYDMLQEYEHELHRLVSHEEKEQKKGKMYTSLLKENEW